MGSTCRAISGEIQPLTVSYAYADLTFNHGVLGSSPSGLTKNPIKSKHFRDQKSRDFQPEQGSNASGRLSGATVLRIGAKKPSSSARRVP